MFGGVGIRLPWAARAAVGIHLSVQNLVLVHLCAAEDARNMWTVVESRIAETPNAELSDTAALAAFVSAELQRAGWERLPLALALSPHAAEIEERTLPVVLGGRELREALLWSLRAEADADGKDLPELIDLLCMPIADAQPQRYWVARMEEDRIRAYFSAFRAVGVDLHRLTVCPPDGHPLVSEIEAAREPRMSWEVAGDDALMSAIYAGLLVRAGTPENLYWTRKRFRGGQMHPYAAAVIAALGTAFFLVGVGADIASYTAAREARDSVAEELVRIETERTRMEAYTALHSDVARREQVLQEFMAASLPLRALLVHLGSIPLDGVRISAVRTEADAVRIEGEAADYAALAAFMGAMEADDFFAAEVTLEYAGHGERATDDSEHVRFTLRSAW